MTKKPVREYWRKRAAFHLRCRAGKEVLDCLCGAPLQSNGEPVQVSGWYGDFYYVWNAGRLTCVDALCTRCREREAWTPTMPVPDDVGGLWIGSHIPALRFVYDDHGNKRPGSGPGSGTYASLDDAIDALARYAAGTRMG